VEAIIERYRGDMADAGATAAAAFHPDIDATTMVEAVKQAQILYGCRATEPTSPQPIYIEPPSAPLVGLPRRTINYTTVLNNTPCTKW
jgi:hypothetical protein